MTTTSGQLGNMAGPGPAARRLRLLALGAAALLLALAFLPPAALQYKMNVLGFAVCQQLMGNTFLIGGNPLPVGARCAGIYLGMLAGLALLSLLRPRSARGPQGAMLATIALMFATMVADGINSSLQSVPGGRGLWETTNPLRMITGALAGLALAFVLYPAFNRSFWRRDLLAREASLEAPSELFGYGAALLVLVAVTVTSSGDSAAGAVYWLVALGSMVGLLIMTTMVNLIALTALTRRSANVTAWGQAALPLLVALALALVELIVLALLREKLAIIVGGVPAGMPTVPGVR